MPIQSLNPATNEVIKTFKALSDDEVTQKLEQAEAAFQSWKATSFEHRTERMRKAAQILRDNAKIYGEIMTKEMGKPLKQAVGEVEKCAWVCDYYAEHAEAMLADDPREADTTKSYIRLAPLGVVLAVMPWNYPLWQVFRFAAPGLMAGNVGVLKHASNVPQSALVIEDVFKQADFPEGAFQTLLIGSRQVEAVIANPIVKAVTLTGSTNAGSKVAEVAGRYLKKTVLELGGSDPFIVIDAENLDETIAGAVLGRYQNTGQSCIAAKRFIVLEEIADAFEAAFVKAVETKVVGDPLDEKTDMGPMARQDLMEELHEQVEQSVAAGATVLTGGNPLEREGAFYAPTILTDVKPGMPAYDDELFGPVASVIRVKSIEEAIAVANDTQFGLGGSVWTADATLGEKVARQINAGAVFVNGIVKSDPRLPFGGIKQSGYGRELSDHGIREFVNVQTVWVK